MYSIVIVMLVIIIAMTVRTYSFSLTKQTELNI